MFIFEFMKQLAISVIFYLFSIFGFSQTYDLGMNPKAKTDSIEALAGFDFFIMGYEEEDPLSKRVVSLANLIIHESEFAEQESLLKHKSRYIPLYAFLGMCNHYFYQITNEHKKIMQSKQPLIMYNRGEKQKFETVGWMAKMMYESSQEMYTNEAIYKPKLEAYIKGLILKYALYPETYYPLLFNHFYYNEDHLSIYHKYMIKNATGLTDTVGHFFVTDINYEIQEISEQSTGTIFSNPAKVSEWLQQYARPVNQQDSVMLNLIKKQW
jgi:hypothetical protein